MFMPKLDYFIQRKVEEVSATENGWTINLEGGAQIVNENPDYELPGEHLVGLVVTRVQHDAGVDVVYFGNKENPEGTMMRLDPESYGLSDPTYTGGETIYPARMAADLTDDTPDDPSPERTQEVDPEEWSPDKEPTESTKMWDADEESDESVSATSNHPGED